MAAMCDDSETETGAAGFLTAALIHTVKALKHALVLLFRNPDAVVAHPQVWAAVSGAAGEDHFFRRGGYSGWRCHTGSCTAHLGNCGCPALGVFSFAQQRYIGSLGIDSQIVCTGADHVFQIQQFKFCFCLAAQCFLGGIQFGKLEDIVDQTQKRRADSFADFLGKLCYILGLAMPVSISSA